METKTVPPVITELDRHDISAILARNHVGRLGFSWGGRMEIRPIHYVYRQGKIYGRTSHGAKFEDLDTLPASVVFEVDEVGSTYHWRSVLVHGSLRLLWPEGSEGEEWRRAVDILRYLNRDSLTQTDPVAFRSLIFQIEMEEVTGRAMDDPRLRPSG